MIYKSQIRSYRDLPLRYFELGTVHRHEKAGVLHGLMRVREFTQDDAHILCTPEQLDAEIKGVADFVSDVMGIFGFEYEMELSAPARRSRSAPMRTGNWPPMRCRRPSRIPGCPMRSTRGTVPSTARRSTSSCAMP